jgi:hypothetical protein
MGEPLLSGIALLAAHIDDSSVKTRVAAINALTAAITAAGWEIGLWYCFILMSL